MASKVTLTDDQIDCYQRDGAILLKGVLDERAQALLAEGVEQCFDNPGKRSTRASDRDGEGLTYLESFPSLQSPALQTLLDTSDIPEIAARMMRAPSSQLILDQIFYKQRGRVIPTPWHQDTPYLRVRGDQMIRIWVTADYTPKELSLQIVRGSHRWNVIYDPRLGGRDGQIRKSGEGKMLEMSSEPGDAPEVPDIERYRDSFDILNWAVAPGDALVFHGNMLHAAGGASDYPGDRRAYTSMWGGPELQYIVPGDGAIPTLAEVNGIEVPHGALIGDHPAAFPVSWQA